MSASRVGILLHHLEQMLGRQRGVGSDANLLDRFLHQRDEQAFNILLQRYAPLVWTVCRRVLGHEQDAEDAFQATFLLLARKAGSIRKRTAVGSWLYGAAHRIALKARCDAARRREADADQPANRPAAHVVPTPADDLTVRELQELVQQELTRLPDRLRAPMLLCYFEGLTLEEAAERLSWSRRLVKYRLEVGRNRLRHRLNRRGLTFTAALTGSLLGAGNAAGLPTGVAQSTLRACISFAAGKPLAGMVTAHVVALAEGAVNAMVISKATTIAVGLLIMLSICGGAMLLGGGQACEPSAEARSLPANEPQAAVDRHGDPLPPGAVARLGTTRFRAFGNSLSFLRDGKTVVSAWGNLVSFCDVHSGKVVRTVETGRLSAGAFTLSPDAKYFAVCSLLEEKEGPPTSGAVAVFETESGKEIRRMQRQGHDANPNYCSLAFSPDSKLLFSIGGSGGDGGVLRIEEIATGLEVLRHQFPRDANARSLALSPDGTTLAVSTGTSKLHLWRWQAGEEPRVLKVPDRVGDSLRFSPDGKLLVEGFHFARYLRIWDVASGQVLHRLQPPESDLYAPDSAVFSPDGKTLVVACRRNTGASSQIHFWDVTTGRHLSRFCTVSPAVYQLAISPDSRILAAIGGGLRVWDLTSRQELSGYDEAHRSYIDAVIATGNLIVTASSDGTIRIWDTATAEQRLKLTHEQWSRALALSPDEKLLATAGYDDRVCLREFPTGRIIYELPGHGKLGYAPVVGFTSDGKSLLSYGDDFYLRKWDTATGKALLEHPIRPAGIKVPGEDAESDEWEMLLGTCGPGIFTPDGKMFVLDTRNSFHVFDVESGKELRQVRYGEGGRFGSKAISPNSQLLLASGHGTPIQTKLPGGGVRSWSPKTHPLCLWDLATGKELRKTLLPFVGSRPVVFSRDGKRYATAVNGDESQIQVFDAATGQIVHSIHGFVGTVQSLAFSPDGSRLISGMSDTTALVWDLSDKGK